MSYTYRHPDMDKTSTGLERSGHDTGTGVNTTRPEQMSRGGESSCKRSDYLPLQVLGAGIPGGVPPLQFMDSINAWSERLGNRSVMHMMGQLRSGEQVPAMHEVAAGGLRGRGRPLTHLDTLQRAFGHHDISGMREHTDSAAGSALNALGAEGYTSRGRMAFAGRHRGYLLRRMKRHMGCSRRRWEIVCN